MEVQVTFVSLSPRELQVDVQREDGATGTVYVSLDHLDKTLSEQVARPWHGKGWSGRIGRQKRPHLIAFINHYSYPQVVEQFNDWLWQALDVSVTWYQQEGAA